MNTIKVSKLLDIISYIGIIGIIGYYIFQKPSSEIILTCLLGVCILRMIGSTLKANYYQKYHKDLTQENEFLQKRIEELKNLEEKK
ncbi:MAG: hypothetical protein PHN41_03395 [Bacteroidales bacterium]|jgi:hypothetical protein|nr:hypothetical protein [Bacteroidales bacterium]MDD4703332.1 hypothetical protein [Bacteroidales bacterium]MDX9798800.1 hypothetical protein [Bacteroidales bacterium]